MVFKEKEIKNNFLLFLAAVIIGVTQIDATNFDCKGKAFYCLNSTHFKICVDLGYGKSMTVDDFILECPQPTICVETNKFECEFQYITTTIKPIRDTEEIYRSSDTVLEDFTTISSEIDLLKSEKYLNNVTTTEDFVKITTMNYYNEITTNYNFDVTSIDNIKTIGTQMKDYDLDLSPKSINDFITDKTPYELSRTDNLSYQTNMQNNMIPNLSTYNLDKISGSIVFSKQETNPIYQEDLGSIGSTSLSDNEPALESGTSVLNGFDNQTEPIDTKFSSVNLIKSSKQSNKTIKSPELGNSRDIRIEKESLKLEITNHENEASTYPQYFDTIETTTKSEYEYAATPNEQNYNSITTTLDDEHNILSDNLTSNTKQSPSTKTPSSGFQTTFDQEYLETSVSDKSTFSEYIGTITAKVLQKDETYPYQGNVDTSTGAVEESENHQTIFNIFNSKSTLQDVEKLQSSNLYTTKNQQSFNDGFNQNYESTTHHVYIKTIATNTLPENDFHVEPTTLNQLSKQDHYVPTTILEDESDLLSDKPLFITETTTSSTNRLDKESQQQNINTSTFLENELMSQGNTVFNKLPDQDYVTILDTFIQNTLHENEKLRSSESQVTNNQPNFTIAIDQNYEITTNPAYFQTIVTETLPSPDLVTHVFSKLSSQKFVTSDNQRKNEFILTASLSKDEKDTSNQMDASTIREHKSILQGNVLIYEFSNPEYVTISTQSNLDTTLQTTLEEIDNSQSTMFEVTPKEQNYAMNNHEASFKTGTVNDQLVLESFNKLQEQKYVTSTSENTITILRESQFAEKNDIHDKILNTEIQTTTDQQDFEAVQNQDYNQIQYIDIMSETSTPYENDFQTVAKSLNNFPNYAIISKPQNYDIIKPTISDIEPEYVSDKPIYFVTESSFQDSSQQDKTAFLDKKTETTVLTKLDPVLETEIQLKYNDYETTTQGHYFDTIKTSQNDAILVPISVDSLQGQDGRLDSTFEQSNIGRNLSNTTKQDELTNRKGLPDVSNLDVFLPNHQNIENKITTLSDKIQTRLDSVFKTDSGSTAPTLNYTDYKSSAYTQYLDITPSSKYNLVSIQANENMDLFDIKYDTTKKETTSSDYFVDTVINKTKQTIPYVTSKSINNEYAPTAEGSVSLIKNAVDIVEKLDDASNFKPSKQNIRTTPTDTQYFDTKITTSQLEKYTDISIDKFNVATESQISIKNSSQQEYGVTKKVDIKQYKKSDITTSTNNKADSVLEKLTSVEQFSNHSNGVMDKKIVETEEKLNQTIVDYGNFRMPDYHLSKLQDKLTMINMKYELKNFQKASDYVATETTNSMGNISTTPLERDSENVNKTYSYSEISDAPILTINIKNITFDIDTSAPGETTELINETLPVTSNDVYPEDIIKKHNTLLPLLFQANNQLNKTIESVAKTTSAIINQDKYNSTFRLSQTNITTEKPLPFTPSAKVNGSTIGSLSYQIPHHHSDLIKMLLDRGNESNNKRTSPNSTKTVVNNMNINETRSRNNITINSITKLREAFSCLNRYRGKYSDKYICSKFYICIGRLDPIVGNCPSNTVFSEITRQCTKNLSHCIRNNEFQCVSSGRFSDVWEMNTYYICVESKNKFVRFKLKCQKGFHLNKNLVTCVEDSIPILTVSVNDYSISKRGSASGSDSISTSGRQVVRNNFSCIKEGKFADPNDCKKYYVCSKTSNSEFRRKKKECDSDEVFHRKKKRCVDADSYECN